MSDCCIISIVWLTSSVDSSIHLIMSLVSHGLLYIHLVHVILLLRSCVDLDGILVLCVTNYCMTTPLLTDCMFHVYVGHTRIPLSLNPQSQPIYLSWLFVWLKTCCFLLAF